MVVHTRRTWPIRRCTPTRTPGTPGQERNWAPVWNTRLYLRTALTISRPWWTVSDMGFSQYTSLPARMAAMAIKRVPVIGDDDRHGVDVRPREQFAEVLIGVATFAPAGGNLRRLGDSAGSAVFGARIRS